MGLGWKEAEVETNFQNILVKEVVDVFNFIMGEKKTGVWIQVVPQLHMDGYGLIPDSTFFLCKRGADGKVIESILLTLENKKATVYPVPAGEKMNEEADLPLSADHAAWWSAHEEHLGGEGPMAQAFTYSCLAGTKYFVLSTGACTWFMERCKDEEGTGASTGAITRAKAKSAGGKARRMGASMGAKAKNAGASMGAKAKSAGAITRAMASSSSSISSSSSKANEEEDEDEEDGFDPLAAPGSHTIHDFGAIRVHETVMATDTGEGGRPALALGWVAFLLRAFNDSERVMPASGAVKLITSLRKKQKAEQKEAKEKREKKKEQERGRLKGGGGGNTEEKLPLEQISFMLDPLEYYPCDNWVVFRQQGVSGHDVVVKMVDAVKNKSGLLVFETEAGVYDALQGLQGTFVPELVFAGEVNLGRFVVVTVYAGGTLDVDTTGLDMVSVRAQPSDALHAIHEAGYVHGDVAARNIAVDDKGHVRIIDFGHAEPLSNPRDRDAAVALDLEALHRVFQGTEMKVE